MKNITPSMHDRLWKRVRAWEKKGYELDGPISLTKSQAQGRVGFLHTKGYKARILKGHFTLYTVVREPFSWNKTKRGK